MADVTDAMLAEQDRSGDVGAERAPAWVYCFGAERDVRAAVVTCPIGAPAGLDRCTTCPFLIDTDLPRARRWSCSTDPEEDVLPGRPKGDH
jgi:hypothetical protein